MRLIKYDNFWNDPFAEIDNLFSRVMSDRARAPGFFNHEAEGSFRVDSYGHENGYEIIAELPGFPKESIDVKLENAVLSITAEHSSGEGDNVRRRKFNRAITVGDDIDAERVSAKFENGLLSVSLPKREERRPKAITVS